MYFLNPGISLWELPNRMYCHLPILILGCTSPLTLWIPSVIVDVQPNTVYIILNSFWSHRMATKIWISRLAYEDLIELGQNFLFLNKSIWFSAKLNQCWHYRDGGMLNLTTTASPFASALWLVRSGEAGAVRARLVGRSKLDPPYNSHPITHSPGSGVWGESGTPKIPGFGSQLQLLCYSTRELGKMVLVPFDLDFDFLRYEYDYKDL